MATPAVADASGVAPSRARTARTGSPDRRANGNTDATASPASRAAMNRDRGAGAPTAVAMTRQRPACSANTTIEKSR